MTGACVAQDRGEWQWTEATAAVAAGAAIVCGRRGHVALAAHIAAYNPSPPVVAAARFAAAKQALYAGIETRLTNFSETGHHNTQTDRHETEVMLSRH